VEMIQNWWLEGLVMLLVGHAAVRHWWQHGMQKSLGLLQARVTALEQTVAAQESAVKPPQRPQAFVVSDAEMAARERQLTATSQSRARLAAQDANRREEEVVYKSRPAVNLGGQIKLTATLPPV
jgi:uncharacterized protein YacL (UPF0231 family)